MTLQYPVSFKRGLIYFVRGKVTGLIKIGFTQYTPMDRLAALQTGSPDILEMMGVIPAFFEAEGQHHQRFLPAWSHGEWFHPTAELLAYIAETARPWRIVQAELQAAKQIGALMRRERRAQRGALRSTPREGPGLKGPVREFTGNEIVALESKPQPNTSNLSLPPWLQERKANHASQEPQGIPPEEPDMAPNSGG